MLEEDEKGEALEQAILITRLMDKKHFSEIVSAITNEDEIEFMRICSDVELNKTMAERFWKLLKTNKNQDLLW